ncbi:MAG: dehydrogenase [Alphaproteobacteria bacterium]|nr:MAG: dehydrogenase [Alphaproteobacteria bacterium]
MLELKHMIRKKKIMLNLDGKTAIVTGCGSEGEGWGNGRAIATLLARQGAKVIGTDLNYKAAKNTQDFILKENNKCEIHEVNMSNKKDVDSFFKNVTKQHEKINILVNNVGRSEPGDPEVMDYDVWREQFSTNLDTAFFAIKQIIPTMKKIGGGSIVNISSVAGMRYVGKPQVGYSASKAALMQMTKTTAIIHAENKIRLNCVVPGLMHTPLVERLANKYADGKYDEFVKTRNNQVPMKKMGSSFDVANAVLFLASDEAKYITGTEIVVDGGLTATTP